MDHDQNFKNLILDYPREALAFLAEAEARAITPDVRITPVRQEQLKERLGERFRELDVPLLVEWPDGSHGALVFIIEEESDPRRFSVHRLVHYCTDLSELLQTRRIVPVVVFLRGGPADRGLSLGSDQDTYLRFHFLSVDLAALPFRRYRDSDNIVARLNLPNMNYEPAEKVEVYAAAVKGLVTLEPNPELQLKYADFIDIYAALDDNERQEYERDHPAEAQIMSGTFQRAREEGERRGEALALTRQMQRKFGDLPDGARRRVESADSDTLLEWLDRILTAESIDEVMH